MNNLLDDLEWFKITGELKSNLILKIKKKLYEEKVSINDILRLYEFLKISKHYKVKGFQELNKKIAKKVFKYFKRLNYQSLFEYLCEVDRNSTRNFWELIEKTGGYKKTSSSTFKQCEKSDNFNLIDILLNKNLSKTFWHEILTFIKENPEWIPTVLNKFIDPTKFDKKLKIPSEIIGNEKIVESIVLAYIKSENSNPNYLRHIYEVPNKNAYILSPEIRYEALKKAEEINDKLFESNNSNTVSLGGGRIQTTFSLSPTEKWFHIKHSEKNGFFKIDYIFSSDWINKYTDYPTLLNNFIYLFGLCDLKCRASYLSNDCNDTLAERLFNDWISTSYHDNFVFRQELIRAVGSLTLYYNYLSKKGIQLEKIIKWFFEKYLPSEFKVKGFKLNIPEGNSDFLEKIRTLLPEIDGLLKQYSSYVKKNCIDWNFLNTLNQPKSINNVPSFIKNKYVYLSSETGKRICYLLFSDQALLSIWNENYKNFSHFMKSNSISKDRLKSWDLPNINYLEDHHVLIHKRKKLILNKNYFYVIKDIYRNHEFEPYYYTKKSCKIIKNMKNDHIIRFGSTLLPEAENDFFSYIMNSKKYTNGLKLRNKYLHQNVIDSKINHQQNYSFVLLILIQIIIRINEEFCYMDKRVPKFQWY